MASNTYRHKTTGEIVTVAKFDTDARTGKKVALIALGRKNRVAYRAIALDLLEKINKAAQ